MAISASHTPRVPDATERYMARFAKDATTQTDQSWVGNPNLKTEYHNQINLTFKGRALAGHWQVHAWADWVNDYILKDWARNQPDAINPVAAGWKDMRIIYINKDALLQGVDLSASWMLDSTTDLSVSTSYVQGNNDTDNRHLAGIPPLSGQVALTHQRGAVLYGARINWASDKTDIDPLGAPDETGKIPGWATLDLYANWRINAQWQLSAGVDNVFDHAYANYLNRKMDPTQGTSYLVNEPGRAFYAKVTARF
jgi:iron complex outermembrane receptor protein